jgi:hypothetical protein
MATVEKPGNDSLVTNIGAIMDVLYAVSNKLSERSILENVIIRYGDPLVLGGRIGGEAIFLSIVRQQFGKRSPSRLRTEASAPGRYASADYVWTFVPAAGSRKKHGDAVTFADRVRIQSFDYTGNYRYLAVDLGDPRSVVAEKTPSNHAASTWFIASATRLRTDESGCVLPDGESKANVEFGKGNYMALISGARYLGLAHDPFEELHHGVTTLPDLPNNGATVWWRAYQSIADAESAY